jgi:hypothetical protein
VQVVIQYRRGPWHENDGDEMNYFESLSGTRRGTTESKSAVVNQNSK